MQWTDILIPAAVFAGLGLVFGAALAIASRVFAVKEDERIAKIAEALPGANIQVVDLSPAFITQGGPGCVAIQYVQE